MTLPDLLARTWTNWLALPEGFDGRLLGEDMQGTDRADFRWLDSAPTYYGWYYALAHALRPTHIAEIGVRYGYSLKAMVEGSRAAPNGAHERLVVKGWDNESYVPGCLEVVRRMMARLQVDAMLYSLNTQGMDRLPAKNVDLFHVDGDHGPVAFLHDMALARQCMAPGGWIIGDDIQACGLEGGARSCAQQWGVPYVDLPTFSNGRNGLCLMGPLP